jgi:16S rRNA (uracil1498-N3)-methyltransferase
VTAPLFLVDPASLAPGHVVIDGDEGRHAADVRRLRPGEPLLVGDGAGRVGEAVVVSAARGTIVVDVAAVSAQPRPQPQFGVAQALAKGGRDEDAVEAMTEVGVDVVLGWQAARSVAKWSDRTQARWVATARAAAKQARRAWVPEVAGVVTTAALAERLARAELAVVLHEDATDPLAQIAVPGAGEVLVVVGPEGGIAPEELDVLSAAGARVCGLGPHVLRTSTAGVAALSVLSAAARWR